MRPAGRGDNESLYFTYPHFNAPEPSARSTAPPNAPVAIVGAGPIGMTTALALAKEGVRSVMFDNKSSFNDGSRAICVARPSFYIIEQIGAIAPFLEKSLPWTTGRTFFRGQQILEFHMPDGPEEKFRPMYNLQQQYIEQFLWQAVEASDLIEMRWQSEVLNVEDTTGGTSLTVRDPAGEYRIHANWVLACDGARSPIRKIRGHRLQGENFEGRYVIADIQMEHDYPTIRRALFDPSSRPGGTVLIHKQPNDIWRIDYQLEDDESADEALLEDNVRSSVAAVLKDIEYKGSWELEWWSVYSANTLALDDYRDGHVFFVGDSAHIVPIFGVRGLNNGLADAANIGWKLGWVVNGKAGEALLDSYTPERRGATLDVFANASKSARFMTPNTHGWKLMRDAALSLALTKPFAGELANPRQMTAFTYNGSPAVLQDDPAFSGGPGVGALMTDLKLNDGFLSDNLGPGFTIICFDAGLARQIEDAFNVDMKGNSVENDGKNAANICNATPHAASNIDATGIDAGNDNALGITNAISPGFVLLSLPSPVSDKLAADRHSAYLIRPDMHIAGRWYEATAQDLVDGYRTVIFNTMPVKQPIRSERANETQ